MDDLYGSPQDDIADDRPCELCGKSIWFGSATECGRFHLGCEVNGLRAALQSEKDAHAAATAQAVVDRSNLLHALGYQTAHGEPLDFCQRLKADADRGFTARDTVAALVAALEAAKRRHTPACNIHRVLQVEGEPERKCVCDAAEKNAAIDRAIASVREPAKGPK